MVGYQAQGGGELTVLGYQAQDDGELTVVGYQAQDGGELMWWDIKHKVVES